MRPRLTQRYFFLSFCRAYKQVHVDTRTVKHLKFVICAPPEDDKYPKLCRVSNLSKQLPRTPLRPATIQLVGCSFATNTSATGTLVFDGDNTYVTGIIDIAAKIATVVVRRCDNGEIVASVRIDSSMFPPTAWPSRAMVSLQFRCGLSSATIAFATGSHFDLQAKSSAEHFSRGFVGFAFC